MAKTLFPNDTVQSKMILHNLSRLFAQPIRTVQELSRCRKQLVMTAA